MRPPRLIILAGDLVRSFPERAEELFKASEENARARWEHLQKLEELYK
jgi:pyruvate-ferredoxin/flavodoxin oxidoreductase